MEFKKYHSIENSYQDDFISSIIEQGFGEMEYVIQEKAHGANLSFITDGSAIIPTKRTELIAEKEEFYNYKTVLGKYESRVLYLYKLISRFYSVKQITIFGELIGGGYPHPDVLKENGAKLVQQGIYYCPQNDFYTYDILLDNKKYLDVKECNSFLEGFKCAKTLFKGNLKECLVYSNIFKTTIPNEFSLPPLEGNLCEGVVIRPVTTTYLRNGSRILIKNKNEKWAENNNYIDNAILKELLREDGELREEATFLCEEIYKLITPNRLNNLISKMGEVNPKKDFGKILGLYNRDTLTDFLKDFKDKYEALEKQEKKAVTKFLNKHAGKLINEYFDT